MEWCSRAQPNGHGSVSFTIKPPQKNLSTTHAISNAYCGQPCAHFDIKAVVTTKLEDDKDYILETNMSTNLHGSNLQALAGNITILATKQRKTFSSHYEGRYLNDQDLVL